jgi:putative membrane protein
MREFLNLLVRWAIVAIGVGLAAEIVPGISYADGRTLLLVVVLLGLFNAFLKPLIVLFTLPFVVLSAGLGLWFINAFLLWGAGRLVDGFHVRSFGAALLGSLIISLTNLVLSMLVGSTKVRRGRRPMPPPAGPADDVIDV